MNKHHPLDIPLISQIRYLDRVVYYSIGILQYHYDDYLSIFIIFRCNFSGDWRYRWGHRRRHCGDDRISYRSSSGSSDRSTFPLWQEAKHSAQDLARYRSESG
jgi:hypothetical protein